MLTFKLSLVVVLKRKVTGSLENQQFAHPANKQGAQQMYRSESSAEKVWPGSAVKQGLEVKRINSFLTLGSLNRAKVFRSVFPQTSKQTDSSEHNQVQRPHKYTAHFPPSHHSACESSAVQRFFWTCWSWLLHLFPSC